MNEVASEVDTPSPPPETPQTPASACWACGNSLARRELICRECGQWQGWRRLTSQSSTLLALLVALLSVAGSVVPKLVALFVEPNIHLVATVAVKDVCELADGCPKEDSPMVTHFEITVTNVGDIDVLLADWMLCNDGSQDTFIDTGDEPVTPTFRTYGPTFVGVRNTQKIDFEYYVYDPSRGDSYFHPPRVVLCTIALAPETAGKHLVLHANDGEFFGSARVIKVRGGRGDPRAFFDAVKKALGESI